MDPKNKWPIWPALVHAKCPRCRRGDMFLNSMYGLHGQIMLKTCSHCDLTYELETGYFYVAMLISYSMNVAEMVTFAVAIDILSGSQNPWVYVIIILTVSLILAPFNFRYSRVILLYWLTPNLHYQPELSEDREEHV
jgi:uncharacterized protein (DUF983 family)